MSAILERHRFNVDEYFRMAEVGVLHHGEGVELIDGIVLWSDAGSPRKYDVEEYERLIETGIISKEERLELIEGSIVEMAPTGPEHVGYTARLVERLTRRLGERALVWSQSTIYLSERNEPEPDICVLRRRDDYYTSRRARAFDILWLIEVADSSLLFDRGEKLRLYARSGIAEVWIVNLKQRQLELYSNGDGDNYLDCRIVLPGQSFTGATMPEESWAIAELLGWNA